MVSSQHFCGVPSPSLNIYTQEGIIKYAFGTGGTVIEAIKIFACELRKIADTVDASV